MNGSVLLHGALLLLLLHKLPAWSRPVAAQPPLTVTILDPDALRDLQVGPKTNLPPKPNNPVPAPRSRLLEPRPAPIAPSLPAHPSAPTTAAPKSEAAPGRRDALLPPMSGREPAPGAPSTAVPSAPAPDQSLDQPSPPLSSGLPFASRQEIDRLARLFSETSKPDEPYTANTEDLKFLSYLAKIARDLEMVWKYPKEAGDRGQQGVTLVKIVIREDGTLNEAELVQSSGYPMLDDEALRAIKRIAPYAPFPKAWHRSQWELTIQFTYELNGVAVHVI